MDDRPKPDLGDYLGVGFLLLTATVLIIIRTVQRNG